MRKGVILKYLPTQFCYIASYINDFKVAQDLLPQRLVKEPKLWQFHSRLLENRLQLQLNNQNL